MLTLPPKPDRPCLLLMLGTVQKLVRDPAFREKVQKKYENKPAVADDLRSRPQLDDAPWVLPDAPRLPCHPPTRMRIDPENPQCGERSVFFVAAAEVLDPATPRTIVTIRYRNQLHVLPVEYGADGPVPVILDPINPPQSAIPQNLTYATVARFFGYGPRQVSPTSAPLEWARQVAERDGSDVRQGVELVRIVRRYADVYPGGRQGLNELVKRFGSTIEDAARKTAKAGKKAGKELVEAGKVAADEYRKRPELGRTLRETLIGYGGPFAVLAIDVVENRLNKRGLTLGPVADSRDADIFAFK